MNSNTSARAVAREIPVQSQLFAKKIGATYSDSYEIPLTKSTLNAEELYREIVSQTPTWINVLMRVRESIVPFVGIRRVGLLGTGHSVRISSRTAGAVQNTLCRQADCERAAHPDSLT